MKISIFAPHWGSNDLPPEVFIAKVKEAGFDGIEMSLLLTAPSATTGSTRSPTPGWT